MIKNLRIIIPPLLLIGFALAPLMTLGQSDGSASPSDPQPASAEEMPASLQETPASSAAPALEASPRPIGVEAAAPTTTTAAVPASASASATPEPVSAPSMDSTPSTSSGQAGSPQAGLGQGGLPPVVFENATTSSTEDAGMNPIIWIVLAALAVVPFGFFAAKMIKGDGGQKDSGEQKDCKRCFDIQRILDEKLAELTDLRGKLEGKLKGMARDQVREAVKGTPAEPVLAAAEKAEKEYGRLKKLFEECMIEFERDAFKGVVVEESLADKNLLEKIKIEKTQQALERTVHDVLASRDTIAEFQKYLADGPWYAHFWKPGKDGVTVVFKDKVFAIRSSDRSTWGEAVAYGRSIGISESELDFPTER